MITIHYSLYAATDHNLTKMRFQHRGRRTRRVDVLPGEHLPAGGVHQDPRGLQRGLIGEPIGIAEKLRNQKHAGGRQGLVQGLLQEFALSSAEGVALMCLAEALLRIPDAATRDALIRDKIGDGDWAGWEWVGGGTFTTCMAVFLNKLYVGNAGTAARFLAAQGVQQGGSDVGLGAVGVGQAGRLGRGDERRGHG